MSPVDIELRHLMHTARRWWWIVAILPVLFGLLGFSLANRQADRYSATSTVLVAPAGMTSSTDYNAILTAQSLTTTYSALIASDPILTQVIADLGLTIPLSTLREEISVSPSSTTLQIRITVDDEDPALAANVANAVVNTFVNRLNDDAQSTTNEVRFELDRQVAQLQVQLGDLEDEIAVQESSGTPTTALTATRDQADALRSLLARLNRLQTTLESQQVNASASAQVWQEASVPDAPFAPRPSVNVIFGVIAGLIATAGVMILIASLDNTVRSSLDGRNDVGVPVLATLSKIPRLGIGRNRIFVITAPATAASEEVRLLRTNLEYLLRAATSPVIGITSPATGDGKSTLAANLAASLALSGYRTALIDGDLRRPKQHENFQLKNDEGLMQALLGDGDWRQLIRRDVVPNLSILPSGGCASNAADLLGLGRMESVLNGMKSSFQYVIVDMPPALGLSDAIVIAADLDGVLVAARSGKTTVDGIRHAIVALRRAGATPLGVAITAAPKQTSEYYAQSAQGRFRWPLLNRQV